MQRASGQHSDIMNLLMKVLTAPAHGQAHVCMCSVQVMYELLRPDPEGGSIADDEGYLPIEIAADKSCEQPSEVMSLVMKMLSEPAQAGTLSGHVQPWREAIRTLAARTASGIVVLLMHSHCAVFIDLLFAAFASSGSSASHAFCVS